MELKSEDFKKVKYNCYDLPPEKDLLDEFPELKRYPEFTSQGHALNHDKVIRYIIYCYDKYTPLMSEKNLIKRKVLACKLAGFDVKEGKFSAPVEDMIVGKNEIVNRMSCCYVRNQKDAHYALLAAGMMNFYDLITKLNAPTDKNAEIEDLNRKTKLYTHTTEMIATLEQSADEIFNGDVQLIYTVDEVAQEEQGKIKSYPEYIASLEESGDIKRIFKDMEKSNVV